MSRHPPGKRSDYCWFNTITTRWIDNDVFQHVNNVNYFSYFDTAVTYYEMTEKVVGLLDGPVHCVVAEDVAAAEGHFVHVFVERGAQRPVPIPEDARAKLALIAVG